MAVLNKPKTPSRPLERRSENIFEISLLKIIIASRYALKILAEFFVAPALFGLFGSVYFMMYNNTIK